MSSLLDSVGTVISYFVDWLSTLTLTLIENPVLQLVFSISIIFSIIRFILCLLIDRNEKKTKKNAYTYDVYSTSGDYTVVQSYDDYKSGVDRYLSGYYDDIEYDDNEETYDTGLFY